MPVEILSGDWLRLEASYFTVGKLHERWHRGWDVTYWRQPLDMTCDEFRDSGFLIERIHEPRPSAQMRERYPDAAQRLSIAPAFIVFSLVNALFDGSRRTEDLLLRRIGYGFEYSLGSSGRLA